MMRTEPGTSASAHLAAVVTEAADAPALARFWARALEWPVAEEGRDRVVVRSARGPALWFEPSARAKTAKNRLHLDLAGGPAEVRRLLDLGATRADIGQGTVPWEVLADPEGNEFCVLPDAEADGHFAQICLDAAQPGVQGPFWSAATGWPIVDEAAYGVRLCAPSTTVPALVMGPPAAPKHERNRLRPVLTGVAPDRLLGLGARRVETGIYSDPEGNEFHVTG